MATPFYSLTCDRCGEKFCADFTSANFVYEFDDGSQLPLERALCWCSVCHAIQEMEDLHYSALVAEVAEKAAELARFSGFLNQLRSGSRQAQVKLRQEIAQASRRIHYLKNRSAPPRCLVCYGTAVTRLQHIEWPKEENISAPSGLVHPGCEGSLLASWTTFLLTELYPTRIHDPSGMFVKEIEDW